MKNAPENTINSALRNKLLAYGLGAAAVAAAATPAAVDATTVTTNTGDITGDNIYFDLQGGLASNTTGTVGVTDFQLHLTPGSFGNKPTITAYNGSLNSVLTSANGAPRLNSGDTIGSGGQSFVSSAFFDNSAGQWSLGSRGFLGLELNDGTNQFFGWADVTLNNVVGTNDAFTLHGFAYDTVAGEPITAGPAIPTPENGSTGLLLILGAAGVVGLHAMRERREKAGA